MLERLRGKFNESEEAGQSLVLPLIISCLAMVSLGLGLVWMNNERTRLSYRAHALQKELTGREELAAKLGVERDSLLSPHELGKKAEAMGLRTALPGQIRRMDPLPAGPETTP